MNCNQLLVLIFISIIYSTTQQAPRSELKTDKDLFDSVLSQSSSSLSSLTSSQLSSLSVNHDNLSSKLRQGEKVSASEEEEEEKEKEDDEKEDDEDEEEEEDEDRNQIEGEIFDDEKKREAIEGNRYIVNGTLAEDGEFPYQVAFLTRNKRFFCGGSLIKSNVILTAAHCLENQDPGEILIRPNYDNQNLANDSRKLYFAEEIRIHPCYDTSNMLADIAMVKLNESISLRSNKLKTIALIGKNEKRIPRNVTVSGWGAVQFMNDAETALLHIDMQLVSENNCRKYYKARLLPGMICAGGGGLDACSGDSGGPMVGRINRRLTQIGVVSWGNRCGAKGYPGIYAQVSYFRDWIDDSLCQFGIPGFDAGSWHARPGGSWGRPPGRPRSRKKNTSRSRHRNRSRSRIYSRGRARQRPRNRNYHRNNQNRG